MEVKKARKKPVEIEFMQFSDINSVEDISSWAEEKLNIKYLISSI